MLRDNLVELIEPMLNSAGANPLALTHHQIQASGDRLPCLENPRPKGAESSLTENVTSPFQAEPAQGDCMSTKGEQQSGLRRALKGLAAINLNAFRVFLTKGAGPAAQYVTHAHRL